jgi:putative transposase
MNKYDPEIHNRRSIRLKGYDYSQAGAYFVTAVTYHREYLFGEIVNGEMVLNNSGKIVQWEWLELPKRFQYIELGAFMVMPNHFHGILIFHDSNVRATHRDLDDAYDNHDGSPLSIDSNVRATRQDLDDSLDNHDGTPRPIDFTVRATPQDLDDSLDNHDGSPRPIDFTVRATHRDLDDALENHDGSPRPCDSTVRATRQDLNDALENHDGSPRPIDFTVRATRPDLNDVRKYNDGSPLLPRGPKPASVGAIMAQFKSRVTKRLWKIPARQGTSIWQRNYFEHIIRNEHEMDRIWRYIESNPARWDEDDENTTASKATL